MTTSCSDHTAPIEYRVLTATRPGLTPDVPPGYESLMWVANSATLIYGKRDAVLVDTFLTLDHAVQLADWIAASGKNLTYIYITHGHGDHFFGINVLKQRFPNVRAVATRFRRRPHGYSARAGHAGRRSGANASLDKYPTSRAPPRACMEHRSSWRDIP